MDFLPKLGGDLTSLFGYIFAGLAVFCGGTYWMSTIKGEKASNAVDFEEAEMTPEKTSLFKSFQRNYLLVYVVVMGSPFLSYFSFFS